MAYPEDHGEVWTEAKIAFAKSEIRTLKAAMAQGVTRVRFADREAHYRDQADMERQLRNMRDDLQAGIDALEGTVARPRRLRQTRFLTRTGH